jgi:ankyrin repeat protein
LEAAISAIKRGADLNYEDDAANSGKTPLQASIEAGNLALVQMLIEKGLPNDADAYAWARSMVAGYYEIADVLKKHGFQAEPGAALLMACKTGVSKSIPRLVEDLDLNDYYYGDEVYGTPLVVAAKFGQNEAADTLMKLGAAAERKDSNGISPWAAAVASGHDGTALLLEKSGAKPEINTALAVACHWGNSKTIREITARGADVNAEIELDRDQVTPLLKCITASTWLDEEGNESYGNDKERLQRESIEFLLQKGANAQWKRNTRGSECSLLHQAVNSAEPSIIPLLVRYGADIETQDSDGDTPLITAIEQGKSSEAWSLLKAGANPNAKDKAKNPAMFAMFRGFGGYSVECIKILLAFGADIKAANAKGWSLRKRCQKAVDDPGQEGGSEENAQALLDFLDDEDACDQAFNLMRDPIATTQDLVNVVEFIRDTINEGAEYLSVIDDFIKTKPEDATHGLTLLSSHEEWRIRVATLRAIESHFGKELEPKTVIDVIAAGSFDDDSDVSTVADRILANNADVVIPILTDRFIEDPLQALPLGALLRAFAMKRSWIIPKIQSAIHENPSQTTGIERLKVGQLLSLKAELEAEDSPDAAIKAAELAVALDPSLQQSCWGTLAELKQSRNDNSLASALEHYIDGSQAEEWGDARNLFEKSINADPSFPWSYNNIAWYLATATEPSKRDGAEAVEFAKKACELDGYHYWSLLDTLAAAYAESGDFENAVRWLSQAITNCPDDTSEMVSILERYRNQEAYPFPEFDDEDDSEDDSEEE